VFAVTFGLGLLASSARADCRNDCIVAVLAQGPDSVMKQRWEAEELARFLKRELLIEYEGDAGEPIKVVPQYEVWTRKSGKPLVVRTGTAVALDRPGRTRIINGIFDSLPRDLQRFLPDDQFSISSVRMLERGEIISWSWSTATTAVVLLASPATKATGQTQRDDQLLVLFIAG
jgi:hypothetical protein